VVRSPSPCVGVSKSSSQGGCDDEDAIRSSKREKFFKMEKMISSLLFSKIGFFYIKSSSNAAALSYFAATSAGVVIESALSSVS
jgi:hypothetical protein